MHRFDYYTARIEAPVPAVIERLSALGHELRPCDGLARRYHYRQGFQVHHNARGVVATVLAGGNGDHPFAWASSEATDDFVDMVRGTWPHDHLPTRLDPSQDFTDRKAYDRLRRVARDIAKTRHLSFPSISDTLNPKAGRTQYVGSPSSPYRVRIYEKGWEQVEKLGIQDPDGLPDDFRIRNYATGELVRPDEWTRIEGQCRPQGEEARRIAATATPEQAWTFTPWMQELAKRALSLDLERAYIRTRKVSTDESALRWMCDQYANMLTRLKTDLGDWQSVGLTIGDMIAEKSANER